MNLDEERVRRLWVMWKQIAWTIFKTAILFLFFMWIYKSLYEAFGIHYIIIIGLVVVELQLMRIGDSLKTKQKRDLGHGM